MAAATAPLLGLECPTDFEKRHNPFTPIGDPNDARFQAHNSLKHRQMHFLTACSELLKRESNATWATHTDIDEFVVFHRFGGQDSATNDTEMMSNQSYQIRNSLPPVDNASMTVIDVDQAGHSSPCCTFPRQLVGALETIHCDSTTRLAQLELLGLKNHSDSPSTLRLVQSSQIGDAEHSRFGKVMTDISRIPNDILLAIHRPFPDLCPFPRPRVPDSFLYHYIWEQCNSRSDGRRVGTTSVHDR